MLSLGVVFAFFFCVAGTPFCRHMESISASSSSGDCSIGPRHNCLKELQVFISLILSMLLSLGVVFCLFLCRWHPIPQALSLFRLPLRLGRITSFYSLILLFVAVAGRRVFSLFCVAGTPFRRHMDSISASSSSSDLFHRRRHGGLISYYYLYYSLLFSSLLSLGVAFVFFCVAGTLFRRH